MNGADRGYVVARDALILALRALKDLDDQGLILVGAQAVYLRAPEAILPAIAPFTHDADVVANPKLIRRAASIFDRLDAAGFSLRGTTAGLYHLADADPDELFASRVDILVPTGVSHLWDPESYSHRDARAAMEQPGLELALVDHSPMTLRRLDGAGEPFSVEVAGIVALLVAKGWKIGERFDQGIEAFAEVQKDIVDVYRLLRASTPQQLQDGLRQLPRDAIFVDTAREGSKRIYDLCKLGGAGSELLAELLGSGDEAEIVKASLGALAEEFDGFVRGI